MTLGDRELFPTFSFVSINGCSGETLQQQSTILAESVLLKEYQDRSSSLFQQTASNRPGTIGTITANVQTICMEFSEHS